MAPAGTPSLESSWQTVSVTHWGRASCGQHLLNAGEGFLAAGSLPPWALDTSLDLNKFREPDSDASVIFLILFASCYFAGIKI